MYQFYGKSIGGVRVVRCTEVVHFSESPLFGKSANRGFTVVVYTRCIY